MFPDSAISPAVKICGLTQEQQARDIIALGADALGINFWPKSKRYLPVEQAATWLPAVKDLTTLVAVMVNPEPALLDTLLKENLVHILQLHGDEPPAEVQFLMDAGAQVIKALQVRDEHSLDQIGDYACETILLDAYNPGLYGGAGETFPWELAVLAGAPIRSQWMSPAEWSPFPGSKISSWWKSSFSRPSRADLQEGRMNQNFL